MKEYYRPGDKGDRGKKRKMIQEIRFNSADNTELIMVPEKLFPIERSVLAFVATSGELNGYQIARKVDRRKYRILYRSGRILKIIKKLETWGYLSHRIEDKYFEGNERLRKYHSITEAGLERLEREFQT
jgi:DNA-binding PadR family transcriptional regulator